MPKTNRAAVAFNPDMTTDNRSNSGRPTGARRSSDASTWDVLVDGEVVAALVCEKDEGRRCWFFEGDGTYDRCGSLAKAKDRAREVLGG